MTIHFYSILFYSKGSRCTKMLTDSRVLGLQTSPLSRIIIKLVDLTSIEYGAVVA